MKNMLALQTLNTALLGLVTYVNLSNQNIIYSMYSNPYLFSLYFFSNFFINIFSQITDYYSTKKAVQNPLVEEENPLFRNKEGKFNSNRKKKVLFSFIPLILLTSLIPYMGIANSITAYTATVINLKNSKKLEEIVWKLYAFIEDIKFNIEKLNLNF